MKLHSCALTIRFLVFWAALFGIANSATYYVAPTGSDNASGSSTAPWRTIAKAAATLVAGDTAIIKNGTYEEPDLNLYNSGTTNNPIVFRAQNKHAAILSSTSGCNPAMGISASCIYIEDLRFSVSSNNEACGIYSSANAAIRAWDNNSPTPANPSTGYFGFRAKGLLVDYSSERSTGIKSNQDYTIIEDCMLYNEIELFNSVGSIVRNNTVYSGSPNNTHIVVKGGARNALVYGNEIRITDNNGIGIYMGTQDFAYWDGEMAGHPGNDYTVYNCVAFNNVVINEGGGTNTGIFGFSGAKNCVIANNVGIGGQIYIAPGYKGLLSVNPTFLNNILVGTSGLHATGAYNGWDGYWTGTLTVDYNNFYGFSGEVPNQAHPVAGNPAFVNNTSDWHLQTGSPCIGAGTIVSVPAFGGGFLDVSKDIDGAVRATPWDLGVYAKTTNAIIRLAEPGRSIFPARGYSFKGTGRNLPIRDILGRAVGNAAVTGMKDAQVNVRSIRNGIYFFESKACLLLK